jgi:hypothetical protein
MPHRMSRNASYNNLHQERGFNSVLEYEYEEPKPSPPIPGINPNYDPS